MAKFRNAQSYYGNTEEMIKHQRNNLIPGNTWRKRRIQELRLNCFWEYAGLGDKQFIYEGIVNFDNLKEFKNIHKKELESEKWLNNWWNGLELGVKKHIYWSMMEPFTPEEKTPILEHIQECLKEKLAILNKE